MRILDEQTDMWKQLGSVCGSRTEALQKMKYVLNSLAAVIHKNNRSVAGDNGKVCAHQISEPYH